jgi:glucose-6-phosphate dehydrogenase assembly protein OpcA
VAQAVNAVNALNLEHVRVSEVLDALGDLRRGVRGAATRTSVVNLVVVATAAADAARAAQAIAGLGARHPGRTVVLVPGPAEGSLVDACVELLGAEIEGHPVWSEQVTLTVCGPLWEHLDSLIEPFTLADLPTAVWYVSALPALADPLLRAADALVVDSKELGDLRAFPQIAELARRNTVVDLSWARLRAWRELLAGLFEGEAYRQYVSEVAHATVAGKEGPRHLLAGWLTSRLGLSRAACTLRDARHVGLRLDAPGATFSVERIEGERVVRATAVVEDGPSHHDVLSLPDETLSWSLADALTHLRRDRVWEQALRGALVFAA